MHVGRDALPEEPRMSADRWHPIQTAIEQPAGVWTLHGEVLGSERRATGVVRIIRRGGEVGYRGELMDGTVVGYWRTLVSAAAETHRGWLETLKITGGPNGERERARVDR